MLLFSHQRVSDYFSWLIRKAPDTGKDWGQEEKGMTEDEMVGWHHWLNRHELEQPPGDGEGQGSRASCRPQGRKESDMIEWLNNKKVQLFVTLMDYSPPRSSAHGILQTRILKWVAICSFKGFFSHPGIEHPISCLAGRFFFYHWPTWVAK